MRPGQALSIENASNVNVLELVKITLFKSTSLFSK